jgi:hypothetical protein
MAVRDWKLGDVAWGWPDDVDRTGTEERGGYRYVPLWQCDGHLGYHVARIYMDEGDPAMESDARLIVAAPALLAALKEVAEECEYRLRKGEDSGDRHTLKLCRAAISKAEGRSDG